MIERVLEIAFMHSYTRSGILRLLDLLVNGVLQ